MELDRALKGRRSVKRFSDKGVSWLPIAEILNAGRIAPSSGNIQNWHFIVVRSKEARESVVKYCVGNEWAIKAPVLIVICSDTEKAKRMFGVRGEALYSIQNCACAATQMMLKAYELGLASCWVGNFDEQHVSRALEIEKNFRPQIILAIGHGESNAELKRYDIESMVSFDKFGEKERKADFSMLPLSTPFKRNIEPMREKLKGAFEGSGSEHKEKLKEFLNRFRKK